MFRHSFYEPVSTKTYIQWGSLVFLAGAINSGGFLACERFVSHVTGFATLFGIDLAMGEWGLAIGILSVPVYFLAGVMLSAFLIERRAREGKRAYSIIMGVETLLLVFCAIGGWLGWFGKFGTELILSRDYLLLAFLCAASGLQNAALTNSSGATIRTTHLTGLTTDLGIGIVRAANLTADDPKRLDEIKANYFRTATIVAFAFGGSVGAFLFLQFGYLGFLLPAAISLYATIAARREERTITRGS